ncbi:hypothetical protein [Devosia submarina]|uniref:hypothetical protein n=1 Tax=Devosia submarina TaxID=1173082 RepID=UPI000D3CFC37|nr:hypothetical protein [Devosia submarina]
MLKSLSACLLLLAAPACAAEWQFESGSTPIAYFDNEGAQFQFACRGGDLAMAFWVRKPDSEVASASTMSLALNAKGNKVSVANDTNFAQDFPLIHSDGSSVLVRGPVARQWARLAQEAGDKIHLAFARTKRDGQLEFLDRQTFGAKNSSAAIGKVLARCG